MSKFMLVYKGDAPDMSAMKPEDAEAERQRWEDWMGQVGSALADPGAPFAPGASIVDDGSKGKLAPLTGYTIVEADDLEAVRILCKDHPFLTEGKGDYAIDVFECLPM